MAGIGATNNIEDNIDFQSYIDAVKQGKIAWDFFVQLMKDLAITTNRQRSLNLILLNEFKNYMEKDRQTQLLEIQNKETESTTNDNAHSKDCSIQKTIEQNSLIQESNIDIQSRILETMTQEENLEESNINTQSKESSIQKSVIQKESMAQKSRILESMIQEEYVESNIDTQSKESSSLTKESMEQKPRILESMEQKSRILESMIQESNDEIREEEDISIKYEFMDKYDFSKDNSDAPLRNFELMDENQDINNINIDQLASLIKRPINDSIESKIVKLVNETKEELIARILNKTETRAPQNLETRKIYGGSKRRCGICRPCLTPECGKCENCLDKPWRGGTGKRRRGCQHRICDKKLKKKSDTNNLKRLKKSRRNSVKQERSICKLCAKSYKNEYILDMHVQTVHKRLKTFSCESCSKSFTQSSGLRYHIQNAHSPDINESKANITSTAGIFFIE